MQLSPLFIVVAVVLLAHRQCCCFGWFGSKESRFDKAIEVITKANPNAETLLEYIKTAGAIRQEGHEDSTTGPFLKSLAELEPLIQQQDRNQFECSSDSFDRLRALHRWLLSADGYSGPRSELPLIRMVLDLQARIATFCFGELSEQFASLKTDHHLDRKRISALEVLEELLDQLPEPEDLTSSSLRSLSKAVIDIRQDLIKNADIETWYQILSQLNRIYHGRRHIADQDQGEAKAKTKTSGKQVGRLYNETVGDTCRYFLLDQELENLLTQTFALASSVKIVQSMLSRVVEKFYIMINMAIGLQVCKDMELVDKDALIKRLTQHINNNDPSVQ